MLSSKAHYRHPTWPPTSHLLPSQFNQKDNVPRSFTKLDTHYTATLPEITEDEDPFSHFLSPVLDEESFEESNYSAGITPYASKSDSASKKDAFYRARLEEKWETFVARRLLQNKIASSSAIPAPLPPPFPQASTSPPAEDALPDLLDDPMDYDAPATPDDGPASPGSMQWYFPSTIDEVDEDSMDDLEDMDDASTDEDLDGWEADRRRQAAKERQRQQLSPRMKFRSSQRTMSGKKHAWRMPSPDLWTVEEELEEEAASDDEGKRGRRRRKRVKTVHWNEEVQVLEYER